MKTYEFINGCEYETDTITHTVTNNMTGAIVTKVWAYPVKQYVLGADRYDTIYFATANERDAYISTHHYCDKLPRCKVYSDQFSNK